MFRLIFLLRSFIRLFSTIQQAKESVENESDEYKDEITSEWPQRILNLTLGYKFVALSVLMGDWDMFGLVDVTDAKHLLVFSGISIILILSGYFFSYMIQSLEKNAVIKDKGEFDLQKFNKNYRKGVLKRRKKREDSKYLPDF